MGLKPVAHILGGFRGWKEAGGPVEPGTGPKPKVDEGKK
jgi:3-mercaptopyruvate sulfurtransferase SseA